MSHRDEDGKRKRQAQEPPSAYLATELAALAAMLAADQHQDDTLHDDELDQIAGGTAPGHDPDAGR